MNLFDLILENVYCNSNEIFNGLIFLNQQNAGKYLVIDGIKRLITFSLLLHAICECFKDTSAKNNKAIELIKKKYLFNVDIPKIQLLDKEKEIYEKIINGQELQNEDKQYPMFMVFQNFLAKIKTSNISALKMFNTIKKVMVLFCVSDNSLVNDLDLYQSINCNNQNVHQQLLLINYFLKQEIGDSSDLQKWFDITDMFKNENMILQMRYFLCDYLSLQCNGIVPNLNELYFSFKNYYYKMKYTGLKPLDIFNIIASYAKIYIKILTGDFEEEEIRQKIETIKDNNMYETFPYLLEIFDDYLSNRITGETLSELLNNIISFVTEQHSGEIESVINFALLSKEINYRMQD